MGKKSRTKRGEINTTAPETVTVSKTPMPKIKGFSSAQFAGLLLISLGVSYIMEYGAAVKDGTTSTACAEYVLQEETTCAELDAVMIKAKYYGAIVTCLSVFSIMLLSWTNEPLFLSFNAILCASPLLTTLWALIMTRDLLTAGVAKIGMMASVLFVVTASYIFSAKKLAHPTRQKLATLQDFALLSFLLMNAKDFGLLLLGGVEGYVNVSFDRISPAAQVLVSFLAVDKMTMVTVIAFALFCFDENRKRVSSLLLFGFIILN